MSCKPGIGVFSVPRGACQRGFGGAGGRGGEGPSLSREAWSCTQHPPPAQSGAPSRVTPVPHPPLAGAAGSTGSSVLPGPCMEASARRERTCVVWRTAVGLGGTPSLYRGDRNELTLQRSSDASGGQELHRAMQRRTLANTDSESRGRKYLSVPTFSTNYRINPLPPEKLLPCQSYRKHERPA